MSLDHLAGFRSPVRGEINITLARRVVAVLHDKLEARYRGQVIDGCPIALDGSLSASTFAWTVTSLHGTSCL